MCWSRCGSRSKSHSVTLARANMTLTFPARLMMVGAMNPCPCGFFGDTTKECRCTGAIIQRYLAKDQRPIIGSHRFAYGSPGRCVQGIALQRRGQCRPRKCGSESTRLANSSTGAASTMPIFRIASSANFACWTRQASEPWRWRCAAWVFRPGRTIVYSKSPERSQISGRSETVSAKHVAEAVQYRSLDRNYWG